MIDSRVNAPVIGRVAKCKADSEFGFPTVANVPNNGTFVGIVSNARTIVQPQVDAAGTVIKQGIVLLTIRNGAKKLAVTIGTAYLGAIDAFAAGIIGKSIEVEFEVCVKGKTTYEDEDGLHFHGIDGNRIVNIEPLDQSSYMELRMEDEKRANLALLKEAGADMSALVAYLSGSAM